MADTVTHVPTVEIVEVSPRDGLQNEATLLATDQKIGLINRSIEAGMRRIEAVSFVNQKLVPAMADAEDVMAGVPKRDDVSYIGVVLSLKGLDRALAAGVDEVNVGLPCSTSFSQRNTRLPLAEAITTYGKVIEEARAQHKRTTLTIAVAFGCPFEGYVPVERVTELTKRMLDYGPDEIALADTIGVGVPSDVTERVQAVQSLIADIPTRVHFHNTRNVGVANVAAAVASGVTAIDASIGGIGGCNFAPKATGNVPTEDVVYMLQRMGYVPDLSLDSLSDTAVWLEAQLGHGVPGLLSKAGGYPEGEKLLPIG